MADIQKKYDVLVAGGGNAALCAAIAAARAGSSVLVCEMASKFYRGGNTRHTRNSRCAHDAATDTLSGPYPEEEFFRDLLQVTGGATDEALARHMSAESKSVLDWLPQQGVRFQPSLGGTLSLGRTNSFFLGGGRAMLNLLYLTAESLGVVVAYEAEVGDLEIDSGMFLSAAVQHGGERHVVRAATFVAACGGFESNIEWLKQYWGAAADNFLIRGTPNNRGTVLKMLLDRDVGETGDPTQCHAVAIDARAPKYDGGIITRLDCVVFGIVVNRDAQRFYDEGEEIWPKRYAIWGRLVAQQPDQIAYIVFDASALTLFMPSLYPLIAAASVRELAGKLSLDPDALRHLGPAGGAAAGPDRLHCVRCERAHAVHAVALSADRGGERARACRQALARSRCAGEDGARLQRGGAPRHVQRHHPRRLPHRRRGAAEIALGAPHRDRAVLRLPGAPRHHLHVSGDAREHRSPHADAGRPPVGQHVRGGRDHGRQCARARLCGRHRHDHRERVRPHRGAGGGQECPQLTCPQLRKPARDRAATRAHCSPRPTG